MDTALPPLVHRSEHVATTAVISRDRSHVQILTQYTHPERETGRPAWPRRRPAWLHIAAAVCNVAWAGLLWFEVARGGVCTRAGGSVVRASAIVFGPVPAAVGVAVACVCGCWISCNPAGLQRGRAIACKRLHVNFTITRAYLRRARAVGSARTCALWRRLTLRMMYVMIPQYHATYTAGCTSLASSTNSRHLH